MKIKGFRGLFFLLTAAVMILIFAFSAQDAQVSGNMSEDVTVWMLPFAAKLSPEEMELLNHMVRKCAHALIYSLLGGFSAGFALTWYRKGRKGCGVFCLAGMAWLFSALYAVSDELHQMFVPGRGPAVSDVLLDCAGAAVGIGAAVTLFLLFKRKN